MMPLDMTLSHLRKQLAELEEQTSRRGLGVYSVRPGVHRDLGRMVGMIDAMTEQERRNHGVIDASRRRRIARGSGTEPCEVKLLVDWFAQARTALRKFHGMTLWQRGRVLLGLDRLTH